MTKWTIIFPSRPGAPTTPDDAWVNEIAAARSAGFEIALLSGGSFGEPLRVAPDVLGPVLYRGWILKPIQYEQLYALVPGLLTTPQSYLWAYDFPKWYAALKELTPRSSIIAWKRPPTMQEITALAEMTFGSGSVLLKDFLKSRKGEWFEACFIRDASDASEVARVVSNFMRLQGDEFYGGLVFREFIDLRKVGIHAKSRMPLVHEFRCFFLSGRPLVTYPYWTDGATYEPGEGPPEAWLLAVGARLCTPFAALDIAQGTDGTWWVIEVNDGSAGLPNPSDAPGFYQALGAPIAGADMAGDGS